MQLVFSPLLYLPQESSCGWGQSLQQLMLHRTSALPKTHKQLHSLSYIQNTVAKDRQANRATSNGNYTSYNTTLAQPQYFLFCATLFSAIWIHCLSANCGRMTSPKQQTDCDNVLKCSWSTRRQSDAFSRHCEISSSHSIPVGGLWLEL